MKPLNSCPKSRNSSRKKYEDDLKLRKKELDLQKQEIDNQSQMMGHIIAGCISTDAATEDAAGKQDVRTHDDKAHE